jgi:predicted glycoside hydrolase/deacetylase ChbG (UPF0249 family)
MSPSQTNRLLGYPADARLLIVNADDFGMCQAVNAAIMGALQAGIVRSTTLMTPCPWARHAMRFLAEHPEVPFGVHLTVIAEWPNYRWGPVAPRGMVPSLINRQGDFYNFDQMPAFLAQVDLTQLEMEFRAQIETVLVAGLRPTHLDWHCLRLEGWDAVYDVMLALAREYGLALRVVVPAHIEKVRGLGLPANDSGFLDSYGVDPATKASHYTQLLRDLPAGLSEWAVHPGLDTPELLAIEPQGNHIRQTDYDFLISAEAQEIVRAEGIVLLDYRALQTVWAALEDERIF